MAARRKKVVRSPSESAYGRSLEELTPAQRKKYRADIKKRGPVKRAPAAPKAKGKVVKQSRAGAAAAARKRAEVFARKKAELDRSLGTRTAGLRHGGKVKKK